jgi:hypothetical protein
MMDPIIERMIRPPDHRHRGNDDPLVIVLGALNPLRQASLSPTHARDALPLCGRLGV